jgi:hypothetical protein
MAEGTLQELDYLTVKLGYSKYRPHVSVMNEGLIKTSSYNRQMCLPSGSLDPYSGILPENQASGTQAE